MRRRALTAALPLVVAAVAVAPADGVAAKRPVPELVSATPSGTAGNGTSGTYGLAMSADGDSVAFSSTATDLGPPVDRPEPQIYVRRRSSGTIELASARADGEPGNALSTRPSISGDGGAVAFLSAATNLDPRDADPGTDAYFAMRGGYVELVSATESGEPANAPTSSVALSADAGTVAFASAATNLNPSDSDGLPDVYVKDLASGAVTLASGGAAADRSVGKLSLSADGDRVAFATTAGLTPQDDNERSDVYVRDLSTGDLTLASTTSGVIGEAGSTDPVLTADGSSVVFGSYASNLDPADPDSDSDIYVKDLATGTLTLVSVTGSGEKANARSALPSISGDGRFVSFASYATNLDPLAADGWDLDVYVKDRVTGDVRLASLAADGTRANGTSLDSALSGAGSTVVFATNATNMSALDGNDVADVYLEDPFPEKGRRHARGPSG